MILRGSSIGKTYEDNLYLRRTFERDSGERKFRGYNIAYVVTEKIK